jgi:hypothetical protein
VWSPQQQLRLRGSGLEPGDLQIHQSVGLDQRGQGLLAQELGRESERKERRTGKRDHDEKLLVISVWHFYITKI